MRIILWTIGKSKDLFFQEAEKHFLGMLRPYCTCEIRVVKDEMVRDKTRAPQALKEEAKRLQKVLLPSCKTIVLDAAGKSFSSEKFAAWLEKHKHTGDKLQFILGGAFGVSPEIKKMADETLSLSPLTLPHQLAKLVFLEQLYRGWTIMTGKQYHY
jgi:23S rRNA (pseudouridine1915-N3)-methyltransferase